MASESRAAGPSHTTYSKSSVFHLGWNTYAIDHTIIGDTAYTAVGSIDPQLPNRLSILRMNMRSGKEPHQHQPNTDPAHQLSPWTTLPHYFPPTHLQFVPQPCPQSLLAVSSDLLRIYTMSNPNQLGSPTFGLETVTELDPCPSSSTVSPISHFHWAPQHNAALATVSCTDGLVTLWDIVMKQPVLNYTMPGASSVHLSPAGRQILTASVSGQVTMLDTRTPQLSRLIYVSPSRRPVCRICRCALRPELIALTLQDSPILTILDTRMGALPLLRLAGHRAPINDLGWSKNGSLLTGSEDGQLLSWSLKESDIGKTSGTGDSGGSDSAHLFFTDRYPIRRLINDDVMCSFSSGSQVCTLIK
eukprot:gnl/Dysnectes_brevis/2408_a2858_884.p1 GENE.gnl/Dysnectes_brevis/2408_a2858_884~~gnl/Dysnectes_brevis/2408_a2858_884.p1  ORF type:complete len:360 (+),score=14.59 gnl/Dysnectes_brevis/2408_a2858_884:123-1202(+)